MANHSQSLYFRAYVAKRIILETEMILLVIFNCLKKDKVYRIKTKTFLMYDETIDKPKIEHGYF